MTEAERMHRQLTGDLLPPGVRDGYGGTQKMQKKRITPAQKKMKKRNYDPIDGMIDQYERLKKEDEYHCAVRDGTLVKVGASGRPVRYSAVAHAAVLAQLSKVHESLLRYNYARVSESVAVENNSSGNGSPVPFLVQLSEDDYHVIAGDTAVSNYAGDEVGDTAVSNCAGDD
jgi:hypothetical protein